MTKIYTRKLTGAERLWLLADKVCPPGVMSMILEGNGILDESRWLTAIEIASAANPGSRLILKGWSMFSKWVDSMQTPPLRIIDGNTWSGFGPEGAPFLQTALSPENGPTCEVLLVQGAKFRVIFRVHHAVMDGHGVMTWVEDIFRALRGEIPIGSSSQLTDYQLARHHQTEMRTPFPIEHIAPTGKAKGQMPGCAWYRIQLRGHFSKLLPQIAILVAKEARHYSSGIVRVGIPINLRHRQKNLRSTANLSIAIYLEITKDTTLKQISEEISQQISSKQDCVLTKGPHNYFPLWLMRILGPKVLTNQHNAGVYSISGLLSNPGQLPIEKYNGAGFYAETGFFIPPVTEFIPLFLVITSAHDLIEIIISTPNVLSTDGRLNRLANSISSGLNPN